MQIRQLALNYMPEADRILLRVNATDQQQFAVWLTRRLCLRLWPHLTSMITQLGVAHEVAQASPGATVLPEAASMLADAARERALRNTDFSQPFEARAASQPLGPEPLLATSVHLAPQAGPTPGQMRVVIADGQGRQLQLMLTEQLATAVRELMHKALLAADWGVVAAPPAEPPPAPTGRVLN